MKFTRIFLSIIIIAVLMISLNNCKKKEVETEVISKVAYLHGGYWQTCSYDFDISTFSYTKSYNDSTFVGGDTIVKHLTLVYNNFDSIYINDTTFFYKKIYMNDTTGSEVYIKQLDAESDIIVRPFSVLQVTLICNLENSVFEDNDILYSDSLPVFTYNPFSGTEGMGEVDASDNVTFAGNFYGGSDMNYTSLFTIDDTNFAVDSTKIKKITGNFEGEIQVNFEFYFNGELVDTKSIYNKSINNGEFIFNKIY